MIHRKSILLVLLIAQTALAADQPFMETVDLFHAGEDGYTTYRIPGIAVTRSGTLLVYCEARKNSSSDWADIDVYLRRSTDGGKTWKPRRLLAESGTQTVNNPVACIDRSSNRIHFLYCVNYARCYYVSSDDDGVTFSEPTEITATFENYRNQYNWNVIATGPGHGIQLASGRLLVPVWLSTGGRKHRPSAVSVIYSDDHGKSWQNGEIVCIHPDPLLNPSETLAVQLPDGRVMLNIRNENTKYRRAVSFSDDGISDWSTPKFSSLFEPICMASLIRIPKSIDERNLLLFANPHSKPDERITNSRWGFRRRENLTVKLSADNGKTWPTTRVIDSGVSGYSDLAIGADGMIFCIYERGGAKGFALEHLTLARFNLAWIHAKP